MNRVLGVDYGEKRIGLAVSDPLGMLATPLRTAEVSGTAQALDAVTEACREKEAECVVVGLPLNMDGTAGPMAEKVEAFVAVLRERLSVPVETWDERLSTAQVERSLLDADLSRRKRKGVRDKLAAQVILQGFLDSRQ
jgi:putative Holliday junction resolvase